MPSTCCCVPGCSNRGGHRFPKDAYVRQQWIKAVRREEEGGIKWKPSTSTVVCKKHFQSDDYFRSDVTYFGKIEKVSVIYFLIIIKEADCIFCQCVFFHVCVS